MERFRNGTFWRMDDRGRSGGGSSDSCTGVGLTDEHCELKLRVHASGDNHVLAGSQFGIIGGEVAADCPSVENRSQRTRHIMHDETVMAEKDHEVVAQAAKRYFFIDQ